MMSYSEYRREMLCDSDRESFFDESPVQIVRSTELHIKRLMGTIRTPELRKAIRELVCALRVERHEAEEWLAQRDYEDYRDQVCNEPR